MRNQRGFSLIEVMTVVAIIGIMAAIAVPNLSQMSRVSKQNEAMSSLAAMYMAEKNFRADQGYYTGCLWQAGYQPPIYGRVYLTGFWNTVPSFVYDNTAATPLQCNCSQSGQPGVQYGVAIRNDATFPPSQGYPSPIGLAPPTTPGDLNNFVAEADGYIGGATDDVWTIDQTQTILNVKSGL